MSSDKWIQHQFFNLKSSLSCYGIAMFSVLDGTGERATGEKANRDGEERATGEKTG